ncbi:MAG TPA: 3-hydroxyacyl-CoA dehydrogenase NAD-binding domain-containing protein [Burkholderiales bacterium]|nr:3-hydroxyacyl-CoA dehydrogenase NAD-binding domain-containing protein [Burkholderiales bacterium]
MSDIVTYAVQGHLGVITLNNPPVNALSVSKGVLQRILDAIKEGEHDTAVKAFLIVGNGRAFCGGADISEFGKPAPVGLANLPQLVSYMDTVTKPMIAGIHGFALGGGLELALACHFRAAIPGAQLGLPEVKLGILPGAHGTQRLPRVLGAARALDMMVSGDPIGTEKALELGLIDEVLKGEMPAAAVQFANRVVREGREIKRTNAGQAALDQPIDEFFKAARARIAKDYRGYPAPLVICDCVEAAVTLPFNKGVQREREGFEKLRASTESRSLRHLFFAEREVSKIPDVPDSTPTREIKAAALIGAGTMGGGIAMNFANVGIPVKILEMSQAALDKGLGIIAKNYAATVAKGRLKQEDMDKRMGLLQGVLEYEAIKDADIVIEAVFEDMEVKKQVFAKLDSVMKPGAILATNTSTLDVNEIAAATKRPEDVLGLHFFSPANVMKLLEVVRAQKTSKETLATAMKLARTIKKVGVVAGVCDGFIGNRMLHAYARQAGFLLEEGALPQQVDKAIEDFGFAMGPFRVGDLAGLDVGWYIRKRQAATRPAHLRYSKIADRICEMGRFGQKTGAGWYRYEAGSRTPIPDPIVEDLIVKTSAEAGIQRREISDEEIVQRCIYALVNTGAKILEEGIALRASDIDIVYVYGYGFPRFRGGPMFYADTVGLDKVYEAVKRFHTEHGEWWTPAPLLERLAKEGGKFNG